MKQNLTWDDTFEIARLLSQIKSQVDLKEVSLGDIQAWTRELPGFTDDDQIVTDQILMDILCIWLEERNE